MPMPYLPFIRRHVLMPYVYYSRRCHHRELSIDTLGLSETTSECGLRLLRCINNTSRCDLSITYKERIISIVTTNGFGSSSIPAALNLFRLGSNRTPIRIVIQRV